MAPPFHPIVDLFPDMTDEEFGKLVDDIRKHGLREPVWLDREGRVIDGKHRVMACALVGVEPTTRVFSGAPADVAAFAVSVNLTRRHLTQSQRAMVASRLAEMGHESEAQNCALTQTKAAEELAVSRRSVQAAEVVRKQGVPELVEAVERGEASVSAAAQVARLPKRAQRAAVAGGTAGVKKAARKAKTPATQKPTWPEGEFTITPDKTQSPPDVIYLQWYEYDHDAGRKVTTTQTHDSDIAYQRVEANDEPSDNADTAP